MTQPNNMTLRITITNLLLIFGTLVSAQVKEITPEFIYKITSLDEVDCRDFLSEKGYKFVDRFESDNNHEAFKQMITAQRKYFGPDTWTSFVYIVKGSTVNYVEISYGDPAITKNLKSVLAPYKKGKSYYRGVDFVTRYVYKNLEYFLREPGSEGRHDTIYASKVDSEPK